ncbi:MAG: hypothetical protein M1822_000201 [Bathelium mastoideum]|nr:MAG: hypothetical protein M1822_000201 [Bathelium mastoideum]
MCFGSSSSKDSSKQSLAPRPIQSSQHQTSRTSPLPLHPPPPPETPPERARRLELERRTKLAMATPTYVPEMRALPAKANTPSSNKRDTKYAVASMTSMPGFYGPV